SYRHDMGMRMWASQNCRMQSPGLDAEIVHIGAAATQQRGILNALQRLPNKGCSIHCQLHDNVLSRTPRNCRIVSVDPVNQELRGGRRQALAAAFQAASSPCCRCDGLLSLAGEECISGDEECTSPLGQGLQMPVRNRARCCFLLGWMV